MLFLKVNAQHTLVKSELRRIYEGRATSCQPILSLIANL